MKSRLAWIGLLFSTFLVACPQLPTANSKPQTPAPTAFKPILLGSVTFDFDSSSKTTKARIDRQTRATTFPAETEFQMTPAFFEAQTPTAGTDRFLNARFNVANLSAATDYSNLSFIAYNRQKLPNLNVAESAFSNIQDFGGGSSNAATWATQLRPTHGMKPNGLGGFVVDDTHADMQIFSPSEANTIQADAQGTLINNGVAGEGVLQYGYVARNATNGRNIVHGTSNNTLTIGLRVPQNGDAGAGNNAYRYSMTFLIFADNITRVSESLEEQGVGSTASTRATALGAQVAYLCNSSLTAGVFIPGAKTAGVVTPTAWIGGNIKITSNAAFGFSTIGNTPKNIAGSSVLGHYAPLDGVSSLNAVAGLGAGTNGSATLVAGNYIFNPNVGVTGAATFKYRVSDGAGCTIPDQSADVSISNMVWYVDSSAAAGGDGRGGTPFQNFSNINGAGGAGDSDAPNDFIYVLKGIGYTTGLALENGQHLIGESVDLIVNSQTLRPATPANVPTLTNAAGNGITLASGNTISGFLVGNVSGTKLIGSSVGTATVDNLTLNGGGAALNINGGNLAVTIDSLSSTSSTNAVSLTGVTGSLTVNAGAISGASGADVLVSGGTANLTFASSINNTSGRSVDIQNRTGGSVTLSGAITDTASGIFLNANSGSSINFTGGLNLSTGTNNAFTATGGGTVSATQNNTSIVNTLTTTTGTALNISSTTIGGSGLTFRSITAGTGAGTAGVGISLDNTGSSGGLTVTGNGSAGSGGTIQHKTGADGSTTGGMGIYLNNTSNVSLARMQLNDFDNYAIRGSTVNGFAISDSVINGTNGTNGTIDTYGEGSVYFGSPSGVTGLTGSATVTNLNISGGFARNFSLVNTSGTLNRFTITGSTFGLTKATSTGNSLTMEARNGGTTLNATVQSSSFLGASGDLFNFTGQTGTVMNLIFGGVGQSNTLSNNHPLNNLGGGGISLSTNGSMRFDVNHNTFRDASGSAVGMYLASTATSLDGNFDNNTIGVSGIADSGSKSGNGIFVSALGGGTITLAITNNTIQRYSGNAGFYGDNTGGSYPVNLTMTGNTIRQPGAGAFAAFALTNGAPSSTDTTNVFAKISGNDFSDGVSAGPDVYLGASGSAAASHTFTLSGATAANVASEVAIETFIKNANNLNNASVNTIVDAYTDAPVTFSAFKASASLPPLPLAPL